MATEWRQAMLGDLIELKRGYDLPQQDRMPGVVPIVSSSGVTDHHAGAMVKGPGVVTGRYGTLGQVFYIAQDFWPLNTTLYVRNFKGNDPRFVSYFLRGLDFLAYSDKAAVPGLNRNHLHQARVRFPTDIGEQREIAQVLATLDDKSELNRRISETLEAIAHALFKSWIVDFDPVRAKARGQDSGLSKPIADLFPDRLEASKLGDIPAGWTGGRLGDVARQMRRGVRPSDIDPVTPYIALDHMPRRSIAIAEWASADGLASSKFEFQRGEILFGKLRPYFHKVGVAPLDGVCSTDIVVLAPSKKTWFGFVLGHASSDAFVDYTDSRSTGTKMPRTNWTAMAEYPVALPPEVICEALTEHIQPIVERIIAGTHESRSLAATREALLPKLISGELRVRHAELALEAVSG